MQLNFFLNFFLKRHDTNFFQNNDILNDQEVIVLNQNEIDLQLRNIENLKKQHFQMEYKKSDSSTENKSQLVRILKYSKK